MSVYVTPRLQHPRDRPSGKSKASTCDPLSSGGDSKRSRRMPFNGQTRGRRITVPEVKSTALHLLSLHCCQALTIAAPMLARGQGSVQRGTDLLGTTRAFPVRQEETVVLGALRVTLQARDQTARLQPASQLGRFRSRALMTDARSVLNTLLGQASTRPKNRLPERRSDRLLINAYRSASVGCSFSLPSVRPELLDRSRRARAVPR